VTGGEIRMEALFLLVFKPGLPAIGFPSWNDFAIALEQADQGDFAIALEQADQGDFAIALERADQGDASGFSQS
jgi:hypothetical protein